MNQNFDYNTPPLENSQQQPIQRQYVTYIPYGLTPEEFEERKEVKKIANTIGMTLLIVFAISSVFSFILKLFLTAFNISIPYEVLIDPAFLSVLNVLLSISLFVLVFALVFKMRGYRISGLIKFKKPKKQDILPFTLLGVSVCAFANVINSFLFSFLASFGVDYEVTYNENPSGIFGFMLTTIAVAIVPALAEEFASRGMILGALNRFGEGFAVMSSAIIFGLIHKNFQQMPFAFLIGLVLGFITVKTKSVWIAVLVHFINNFVSVSIDFLFKGMSAENQNIIFGIYIVVCLLAGLWAIYLLKDRKNIFAFKKSKAKAPQKKLYKWFFSSATIVIITIICLLESLVYFT